jgi:DNA recombination-dependent growth factor C
MRLLIINYLYEGVITFINKQSFVSKLNKKIVFDFQNCVIIYFNKHLKCLLSKFIIIKNKLAEYRLKETERKENFIQKQKEKQKKENEIADKLLIFEKENDLLRAEIARLKTNNSR